MEGVFVVNDRQPDPELLRRVQELESVVATCADLLEPYSHEISAAEVAYRILKAMKNGEPRGQTPREIQ